MFIKNLPFNGEYAMLNNLEPITGEWNWVTNVPLLLWKHRTRPFSRSAVHNSPLSSANMRA